jgi:hypothetical protein
MTLGVDYLAQVIGLDLSPLFIATPDLAKPVLVSLIGETRDTAPVADTFTQQAPNKVDILLVIDNSESMADKQQRIFNAVPAFVSTLTSNKIDFQVGVTTTGMTPSSNAGCPGGAQGGEAGRLFPADNSSSRILTSSTSNLTSTLTNNVDVGTCQFGEEGFAPMELALSSPLITSAKDPGTPLPNDGNLGFLRNDAPWRWSSSAMTTITRRTPFRATCNSSSGSRAHNSRSASPSTPSASPTKYVAARPAPGRDTSRPPWPPAAASSGSAPPTSLRS